MKQFLLWNVIITGLLISGCEKKFAPTWDVGTTYKVEGYIYNAETKHPYHGVALALSQTGTKYSHDEPFCVTDSTGYFAIEYIPTLEKGYVDIHPKLKDDSCPIDNSILKNLTKGRNINVGKIYY